jgi:ABC-type multidrug transport system ATPase subunit
MTVQETCKLHAALRLGRGTTQARREERIEEVLASMNMLHARHTL